jgi:hypothetical protein
MNASAATGAEVKSVHTHHWYIRQTHPLKRPDGLSVAWACLDCRAERVTTAVLPVPGSEGES